MSSAALKSKFKFGAAVLLSVLNVLTAQPALAQFTCEQYLAGQHAAEETVVLPLPSSRTRTSQREQPAEPTRTEIPDDASAPPPVRVERSVFNLLNRFFSRQRARRRPFDMAAFDRAKRSYEHLALSEFRRTAAPRSPEETLAYYEVFSRRRGNSVLKVENWMAHLTPGDRVKVRNWLSKTSFRTRDVRSNEVEDVFVKLYWLAHADPLSFSEILSRPTSEAMRTYVIQRFNLEVGRRNLTDAARSMGLLARGGITEKIREIERTHPMLMNSIYSAGLTTAHVALWGIPGEKTRSFIHFNFLTRETAELAEQDPELVWRRMEGQFLQDSPAYTHERLPPQVQRDAERAMQLARYDFGQRWGAHVISTSLMALFIGAVFAHLGRFGMTQFLPTGVTSPNDDYAQFVVHTYQYLMRIFRARVGLPPPPGEVAPEQAYVRSVDRTTQDLGHLADQIQNSQTQNSNFNSIDGQGTPEFVPPTVPLPPAGGGVLTPAQISPEEMAAAAQRLGLPAPAPPTTAQVQDVQQNNPYLQVESGHPDNAIVSTTTPITHTPGSAPEGAAPAPTASVAPAASVPAADQNSPAAGTESNSAPSTDDNAPVDLSAPIGN